MADKVCKGLDATEEAIKNDKTDPDNLEIEIDAKIWGEIIAKDENGDNFEKYDLNSSEDVHFLNGFGKMVIVR